MFPVGSVRIGFGIFTGELWGLTDHGDDVVKECWFTVDVQLFAGGSHQEICQKSVCWSSSREGIGKGSVFGGLLACLPFLIPRGCGAHKWWCFVCLLLAVRTIRAALGARGKFLLEWGVVHSVFTFVLFLHGAPSVRHRRGKVRSSCLSRAHDALNSCLFRGCS